MGPQNNNTLQSCALRSNFLKDPHPLNSLSMPKFPKLGKNKSPNEPKKNTKPSGETKSTELSQKGSATPKAKSVVKEPEQPVTAKEESTPPRKESIPPAIETLKPQTASHENIRMSADSSDTLKKFRLSNDSHHEFGDESGDPYEKWDSQPPPTEPMNNPVNDDPKNEACPKSGPPQCKCCTWGDVLHGFLSYWKRLFTFPLARDPISFRRQSDFHPGGRIFCKHLNGCLVVIVSKFCHLIV